MKEEILINYFIITEKLVIEFQNGNVDIGNETKIKSNFEKAFISFAHGEY